MKTLWFWIKVGFYAIGLVAAVIMLMAVAAWQDARDWWRGRRGQSG